MTSKTDATGKGRVLVSVPSAGLSGSWAPVCVAPGSSGGSFPVGSQVVVAFENGDPSFPIVLGKI
ncbi:MAG: hypothetical protein J0L64_26405 [Acidobacteria bacterium]|nr:hypothetical protein [Acidobacteriota bacterium]